MMWRTYRLYLGFQWNVLKQLCPKIVGKIAHKTSGLSFNVELEMIMNELNVFFFNVDQGSYY